MRFFSSKLTVAVATTALAVSSLGLVAGPAQASTGNVSGESGKCAVSKADSTQDTTDMNQITGEDAKKSLDYVTGGMNDGIFKSHAEPSTLALDKAKVYKVTSGDQEFTSVTIPVEGKYATTSNLTVLLDSEGERVNYSEVLYSHGAEGKFHLDKYENGKTSEDRDTDITYKTNAQISEEDESIPTGEISSQKSTGDKVSCVAAVLGVSGTTGYLIVGACAGACAASETGVTIPVCVACIGAYAAVGGASVTAVASCFN